MNMLFYIIGIVYSIILAGLDIYLAKKEYLYSAMAVNIIISIAAIIQYSKQVTIDRFTKQYIVLLIVFALWNSINTLIVGINYSNITYVLLPFAGILILLGMEYYFNKLNMIKKYYLITIIGVAYIIVLGGIIIDIIKPGTYSSLLTRAAGINVNANNAALRLILLNIPMVVMLKSRKSRICIMITTSLGVIFTLSRAGIIYVMIQWIFMWINNHQLNVWSIIGIRTKMFYIIIFVLLFIAGRDVLYNTITSVSIFDNYTSKKRINKILLKDDYYNVDDERIQITKVYFQMISANPIVGYGAGYSANNNITNIATHNIYTKIWLESGIMGLALYHSMYVVLFINAARNKKPSIILLILIITIAGMFTNTLMDNRTLYGVLIITIMLSKKMVQNEKVI